MAVVVVATLRCDRDEKFVMQGYFSKLPLVFLLLISWQAFPSVLESTPAGLPALQDGESGQVRKEAATAVFCKCRGLGSPPSFTLWI